MSSDNAARRPRRVRTAPAPSVDEAKPGRDDAAERLASILAEYGGEGGYRVRIERYDTRGDADYLGTVDLTGNLLDDVKANYGGGKYRGRVVDASGAYKTSIRFGIAGPARVPDQPATPVASTEASALHATLASIAETQRQIVAMIARPPATPDPFEQMERLSTVMKNLAPTTPPAAPAVSETRMFDMLERMLDVRERIIDTAPETPRSGIEAVIEKGVAPALSLIERKIAADERRESRAAGRPAAARAIPAASPAPVSSALVATPVPPSAPAPVSNVPTSSGSADPIVHLCASIPALGRAYLLDQARNDRDPEVYAAVILDAVGDDVYNMLPDLLDRPDFVETFVGALPAFAPYREWLANLVSAMRASLAEASADGEGTGEDSAAQGTTDSESEAAA